MVVRKTLDNLRERPKEERTAIAASIALGVVAILFVGWLIYFFHNIESGSSNQNLPNLQNVSQQYNASGLSQAQQQLQQAYASSSDIIDQLQAEAEAGAASGTVQTQTTNQ